MLQRSFSVILKLDNSVNISKSRIAFSDFIEIRYNLMIGKIKNKNKGIQIRKALVGFIFKSGGCNKLCYFRN